MKLVRFDDDLLGLLVEDVSGANVLDIAASLAALGAAGNTIAGCLEHGGGWLPVIEKWNQTRGALATLTRLASEAPQELALRPLGSVTLRAPLRPTAILCGGQNYADHLDEMPPPPLTRAQRGGPSTFMKLPQTVVGPDEPIRYPAGVTAKLDFEVELAAVIGRAGFEIPPERALEHVFGYTILNDLTLRDRQVIFRPDGVVVHSVGVTKNFDGAAPLGPGVVTSDEIPDPQRLAISSRLNGVARQSDHTSNMIDTVAEYVSYFSRFVTLQPGFVISTGTGGGTGWGMDPQLGGKRPVDAVGRPFLEAGDRIECTIEGIGTLTNMIV